MKPNEESVEEVAKALFQVEWNNKGLDHDYAATSHYWKASARAAITAYIKAEIEAGRGNANVEFIYCKHCEKDTVLPSPVLILRMESE